MGLINVGGADRIIRIAVGIIILGIGCISHSWWGLVGLLPLLTGTIRTCPIYLPMKFSSAKKKKE